MKPAIFLLTCKDKKEANQIAKKLLESKLIVCAKTLPIESMFWWKKKIEKSKEILLIMETEESKFISVEKEVKKLHSYETPVLISIKISEVSKGVETWLKENLKK